MVSIDSPEGAALRASQLASPEKWRSLKKFAVERPKNETPPHGRRYPTGDNNG